MQAIPAYILWHPDGTGVKSAFQGRPVVPAPIGVEPPASAIGATTRHCSLTPGNRDRCILTYDLDAREYTAYLAEQ
jgi:hypothetical protein